MMLQRGKITYGCLFFCDQDRYGSYWDMEWSDHHLSDEKDLVQARAEHEPVCWMTLAYPTDKIWQAAEKRHHRWFHCRKTIIRSEAVLVFSQAQLWNLDFYLLKGCHFRVEFRLFPGTLNIVVIYRPSSKWAFVMKTAFIQKDMVLILICCAYFYLVM